MKEQLINFETVKLAKEKGFNIPKNSVPTQSLLQKWLREIHKIEITIETVWKDQSRSEVNYSPWIYYTAEEEDLNLEDEAPIFFKKYEDALEHALQEGLNTIK